MKKLVGVLVALVIVLSGLLIFEYVKDAKEETKAKGEDKTTSTEDITASTEEAGKPTEEPTEDKRNYKYKDIESMEKATSVKEAYERIFGKERLFDDFKENSSFNGEMSYYLTGVYDFKNVPDRSKYYPDKQYYLYYVSISITLNPEFDTRMEMIDFLHYLQYSGLTKPHNIIKEPLPEEYATVHKVVSTMPEKSEPFTIDMKVYQTIKPGMNTPESHQGWSIKSDVIEVMDFSNKDDILNSITQYGKFQGVNPSGMN